MGRYPGTMDGSGRASGDTGGVEQHPVDSRGRPDLRTFHRSAEFYAQLHLEGVEEFDFHKRVEGQWGLIARGKDAVAHLVNLLHHPDPEGRADGATGLAQIGETDPAVQSTLIATLEHAATHEERDTLLQALGQMRSRAALPAIARLIRSDATDGDTQAMAIEALGKIARKRFDKRPGPRAAALEYLARSGA